ncbi:MAG: ABC transporter ATP-binding protein/permease, partial [Oscillospiraceae bacterium]|nr:ABC transporter ATP-binding protein/permease [Oscillospiraceae bacterium]
QMIIRMGVRAPVMMVFALIFAFRINAQLSLVFLSVIPVLGLGLWLIISHVHPLFKKIFKSYDKLNRVVQENLHGIRVVKSFVREDHEIEKFEEVSKSIFDDFSKAEKRIAFNMPLMQFCLYACMLLLAWFGAQSIIASGNTPGLGLTTGELASLITYTMMILMSLMMLSMVFVMIIISRASAERIVEILDEKSNLVNGDNPIYNLPNGSIDFENVTFSYSDKGGKPVLDNINLHIESGKTVGIIGGTGSSKSSIVQLIPRLYDVLSGSVSVGGTNVKDYDLETLRNNVAMVLQKNTLFSGTIKENLRWGNEAATDEDLINACKLAHADSFIQDFPDKYDTKIEQGGVNVSGGQRQRLCIARALLKKPKILILDDSTSAVDTKTENMIREEFNTGIPDVTVIIIAQRILSIKNADKIVVMDDGCIVSTGKHDEVIKTCEIYKEVYESQDRGLGL